MDLALIVHDDELNKDVVENIIIADSIQWATDNLGGTWIDTDGHGVVSIGDYWTGTVFEAAPVVLAPTHRTELVGAEFVASFTSQEWQWIKTTRATGTANGDLLDQQMDAIQLADSVDVASTTMDAFYNVLLAEGIPGGQTRIDALRAGIPL